MRRCQNCELVLNNRDWDIGICPNCDADLTIQVEEDSKPILEDEKELRFIDDDIPYLGNEDLDFDERY